MTSDHVHPIGPRAGARSAQRGLTLVEVLIVITLMMMLTGGMMAGVGQVQRSRLKGSATRVAAAMRSGYQRSSSTGRQLRMVVDIEGASVWLEESNDVMLLKTDDLAGSGGAAPATDVERAAEAEANRIASGVQTARASFAAVAGAAGQPQKLYSGIVVKGVDATHVTEVKSSGRGYVYFFGAEAERASVWLSIAGEENEKNMFSVVLSPLTGKASIEEGLVAVKHPKSDAEASDAEDNGF